MIHRIDRDLYDHLDGEDEAQREEREAERDRQADARMRERDAIDDMEPDQC